MNTITNLVISFVVFMISTVFSFIGAFKGPIIIGALIGSVVLLFPAGAHASDLIISCGGYGNIPLQECEGIAREIKNERTIGMVLFVLIWVILVPGILYWDYKEKAARKTEWQKELDAYMEKLNSK